MAEPKANCPACAEKRRHTPEDWAHHPEAGTGHNNEMAQPKQAVPNA